MRNVFGHFVGIVCRIGQQQLLRGQIQNELNLSSKIDSNTLACAIDNLNNSIMVDVHAYYRNPELPYPKDDSPLLAEFTKYLEAAGFNHPISKIYLTIKPLEDFPLFMFFLVLSMIPKLTYDKGFGGLICKGRDQLDGVPFVMGVITILKQFHSSVTHTFLAYLGQFVRGHINNSYTRASKAEELSEEVLNVLIFLEDFCKYGHFSRKVVEGYVPPYIFDYFKH
jgi:WASH complex subunit strumpellin